MPVGGGESLGARTLRLSIPHGLWRPLSANGPVPLENGVGLRVDVSPAGFSRARKESAPSQGRRTHRSPRLRGSRSRVPGAEGKRGLASEPSARISPFPRRATSPAAAGTRFARLRLLATRRRLPRKSGERTRLHTPRKRASRRPFSPRPLFGCGVREDPRGARSGGGDGHHGVNQSISRGSAGRSGRRHRRLGRASGSARRGVWVWVWVWGEPGRFRRHLPRSAPGSLLALILQLPPSVDRATAWGTARSAAAWARGSRVGRSPPARVADRPARTGLG